MLLIIPIISYLLGSIPFGFILAYGVKRIDIRKCGSGNIGATNVARVVGKKWGLLVFAFDFLKGLLPIVLLYFIFSSSSLFIYILTAFGAIAGHNWSIFLKFKGGKGVATSIGAVTGLCFKYRLLFFPLLGGLGAWVIIFMIFRIVSLASLSASFVFFILSLFFLENNFKLVAFLIFLFILIRHRENISNLLHKKELPI